MLIKNPLLAKLLIKLFKLDNEVKRVHYEFLNENLDHELTELAFLNQSLDKFETSSDNFKQTLQNEIEKTCNKTVRRSDESDR